MSPADVASGDVAFVTSVAVAIPVKSEALASEPDVNVSSVKLRVAYVQISAVVGAAPLVRVLVGAYATFHTSAARAPNDDNVLPLAAQTCAADRLLSADIDAAVASGDTADVS